KASWATPRRRCGSGSGMSQLKNYFAILDLEPDASPEEIRRAYRDLVKIWHPDRFEHDARLKQKAQERLKQINEAYEVLRHYPSQPPPPPASPGPPPHGKPQTSQGPSPPPQSEPSRPFSQPDDSKGRYVGFGVKALLLISCLLVAAALLATA